MNHVNEVIIVTSKPTSVFTEHIDKIKAAHSIGGKPKLAIKVFHMEQPKSFCDCIRTVADHEELREEFIVVDGNFVSNVDL